MLGSDYYVLLLNWQWKFSPKDKLVSKPTFDKMLEKNPAFDVGVLLLTSQWNFIATRRFADQDHI
jgi:hypothetical protein